MITEKTIFMIAALTKDSSVLAGNLRFLSIVSAVYKVTTDDESDTTFSLKEFELGAADHSQPMAA